jgi:hypothetical protein
MGYMRICPKVSETWVTLPANGRNRMNELPKRYSGDLSRDFWMLIASIKDPGTHDTLCLLGYVLQEVEQRMHQALGNAIKGEDRAIQRDRNKARFCECGAAESGDEHEPWCPWASDLCAPSDESWCQRHGSRMNGAECVKKQAMKR